VTANGYTFGDIDTELYFCDIDVQRGFLYTATDDTAPFIVYKVRTSDFIIVANATANKTASDETSDGLYGWQINVNTHTQQVFVPDDDWYAISEFGPETLELTATAAANSQSETGLTQGGKIGVGIGVAVFGVIVIVVIVVLVVSKSGAAASAAAAPSN